MDVIEMSLLVSKLQDERDQLLTACKKMIEVTGGSEAWNGETHDALVLIETAIKNVLEN